MVWGGIGGSTQALNSPNNPVGAGLLAKAGCEASWLSGDTTPSRASPLPHWSCVGS